MNTQRESSAYPKGVLDVSILVPACFENPLKEHSVDFISQVLTQEKPAALPVSAILGAYHITTRYLGVPRIAAKKVFEGILRTVYVTIPKHLSPNRVGCSRLAYNVESWDGYLISLTRNLGSTIIYSLDEKLSKVKEITVVNPFPSEAVKRYHTYLTDQLKR